MFFSCYIDTDEPRKLSVDVREPLNLSIRCFLLSLTSWWAKIKRSTKNGAYYGQQARRIIAVGLEGWEFESFNWWQNSSFENTSHLSRILCVICRVLFKLRHNTNATWQRMQLARSMRLTALQDCSARPPALTIHGKSADYRQIFRLVLQMRVDFSWQLSVKNEWKEMWFTWSHSVPFRQILVRTKAICSEP